MVFSLVDDVVGQPIRVGVVGAFFFHLDRANFDSRVCSEFQLGVAFRNPDRFVQIPGEYVVITYLNLSGFIQRSFFPFTIRACKDDSLFYQRLRGFELAIVLQFFDVAFAAFQESLMAFIRP